MYILNRNTIEALKIFQKNNSKNELIIDEILNTQEDIICTLRALKHPLVLQTIASQLILAAQEGETPVILENIEDMEEEISSALELQLNKSKALLSHIKETELILSNNH